MSDSFDKNQIMLIADGSSGNRALEIKMAMLLSEYFELWKKKYHDYGPDNIAAIGEPGILLRLFDKVQRLKNILLIKGGKHLLSECCIDTWMDILGYGLIGLAVHKRFWPSCDNDTIIEKVREFFKQASSSKQILGRAAIRRVRKKL